MIPIDRAKLSLLVTGGAGFIGSHLVERLVTLGHRVTVLDDGSTGELDRLPASVRVLAGCVADPSTWRAPRPTFDGVFHLAGIVGMRLAVEMQDRAYRIGIEGTRRVLEQVDAPLMLFSSSAVYGNSGRSTGDEAEEVDEAQTLAYDAGRPGYGLGKLHAEGLARSRNPGRVLAIRPFNVVGPRQGSANGMVLPTFIAAAREGRPLVVYDDGRQTRSFCDVHGFIDALLRLASCQPAWRLPIPAVNVGNDRETEVLELARLVLQATGSSAPIRFRPYAEAFPGRSDLRSRKPNLRRLHALIGRPDWLPIEGIVSEVAGATRAIPEEAIAVA